MIEALQRLIHHLRWADRCILDALRRPGAATPRALDIYAHILAAENVWISRVVGLQPSVAVWPTLSRDECEALAHSTHEMLDQFLRHLEPDGVERNVHYANSAGDEFDSRLSDILIHVALHGAYHRGQVNMLIRDAGAEPEPTDYIALVRGSPAARTPRS